MAFYRIRETQQQVTSGITNYTTTEVSATGTATDLISANSSRRSLSIINESDYEMLVNVGTATSAAASTTSKIKIIPPQTEYSWEAHELPLGALNAVWVGGTPTGKAVIVEGT